MRRGECFPPRQHGVRIPTPPRWELWQKAVAPNGDFGRNRLQRSHHFVHLKISPSYWQDCRLRTMMMIQFVDIKPSPDGEGFCLLAGNAPPAWFALEHHAV